MHVSVYTSTAKRQPTVFFFFSFRPVTGRFALASFVLTLEKGGTTTRRRAHKQRKPLDLHALNGRVLCNAGMLLVVRTLASTTVEYKFAPPSMFYPDIDAKLLNTLFSLSHADNDMEVMTA